MAYIGNTVQNQGFTPAIDYFSGNGVTVTFTLSRPVVSVAQMIVSIDNVIQNPSSAYTVSGSSITFTSAPLSGTNNIWVEYTSLITTYAAISQSPSVIGDITASGGYLATGSFGNTFVDGTIIDYTTGNARITTGPADGLTIYNGGTSARTALAAWDTSGNLTNTGSGSFQGVYIGKGGGTIATNTAVGISALASNTTGIQNTAFGYQSLYSQTVGQSNTAVGYQALYNTNGSSVSFNTAVGIQAGYSNVSGTRNVCIGGFAGYSNLSSRNMFIGYSTGYANSTGVGNCAVGNPDESSNSNLENNTTGSYNSSFGNGALRANTISSSNTAIGYQALYSTTSGSDRNTAVGYQAGYSQGSSATDNAYFGRNAGYSNTSYGNTYIGATAGYYNTTGHSNTIIGAFNGNQASLDIRTASNRIVLSDGDGNPKAFYDGSTWNFAAAAGTNLNNVSIDNAQIYGYPDNTFKCGYPSYRWTVVYAVSGTINTSDANQKQQIRSLDEAELAVAKRIKGLIKTFKWNDSVAEKGDGARIHVGVIAQEVQEAFEAEGLDASKYGMFCSDTWYEVNGDKGRPANPYTAEDEGAVEVTQLGVRYDQLLAFVIAAL